MSSASTGQVTGSAAEIYEKFFVPALFAQWAPRVADAAGIAAGMRVLDVACGTGVLAHEAARRVGPGGAVTGIDRNDGMLAVAARAPGAVEWRNGIAEMLPFADSSFDAVVSQFGLMFFDDRVAALAEMWRVLRPGGVLAAAVWAALDETPGYAAMTHLLQELFGGAAADALRAPYCLGDRAALETLFVEAGIAGATVRTLDGTARFPSIEDWVHTDVKGWTLADLIDDAQYRALQDAAQHKLAGFTLADGSVRFRHPALIVTARKA